MTPVVSVGGGRHRRWTRIGLSLSAAAMAAVVALSSVALADNLAVITIPSGTTAAGTWDAYLSDSTCDHLNTYFWGNDIDYTAYAFTSGDEVEAEYVNAYSGYLNPNPPDSDVDDYVYMNMVAVDSVNDTSYPYWAWPYSIIHYVGGSMDWYPDKYLGYAPNESAYIQIEMAATDNSSVGGNCAAYSYTVFQPD